MAASPHCAGVLAVVGWGPKKLPSSQEFDNAAIKPHWVIMIDFIAGKHKQNWTMVHSVRHSLMQGEADPKELANAVCAIITGQGGKIVN
jgi:hypothetical protein